MVTELGTKKILIIYYKKVQNELNKDGAGLSELHMHWKWCLAI